MSREIRFRVWQQEKNRFCQGHISHDGKLYFIHYDPEVKADGRFGHYIGACVPRSPEEYVVEQFTGLKDSKGVEIYEGDIVRSTYRILKVTSDPDRYVVRPVEWLSEGGWSIACLQVKSNQVPYEVIGNIHEHPHLILKP